MQENPRGRRVGLKWSHKLSCSSQQFSSLRCLYLQYPSLIYAHIPPCESLFLSWRSTAKSGMSTTPSDTVSFNKVSVMNAIVIFLRKLNSRTSSTSGTRDITFATNRFGTLLGVSLWVDPVPVFCEQSTWILLVLQTVEVRPWIFNCFLVGLCKWCSSDLMEFETIGESAKLRKSIFILLPLTMTGMGLCFRCPARLPRRVGGKGDMCNFVNFPHI